MSEAARLYTPAILALAVELADFPLAGKWDARGSARATQCGSTLDLGIELDELGRITRIGLNATACAIGQASAAIFARHAAGRDADDIDNAREGLQAWLDGDGTEPAWPQLALLEQARTYSARHGAIMLGWNAAAHALPFARVRS